MADTSDAKYRQWVPFSGTPLLWLAVGLLVAGYGVIAWFMWKLGFNFMQGDALTYWQDSFSWQAAFNALYAPLYLWELALVRTITFGLITSIFLMMLVNVISLAICGWLIYRIVKASGAPDELAAGAVLLFGLWPLVGLTYTVFPKTDIPALAIYLSGVYLLIKNRPQAGAAVLGLAMLAHNVLWPLSPMTLAGFFLTQKTRPNIKTIGVSAVLIATPLTLLVIGGALFTGTFAWTLSGNLRHVESYGYLPVLDGALGTFLRGGYAQILKGLIVAGVTALAVWLAYQSYRQRSPFYGMSIAICALIVILWLILNSFEIWGLVRFSRLLALPILWLGVGWVRQTSIPWQKWRPAILGGVALLFLSQIVYAWYMVKIFFE